MLILNWILGHVHGVFNIHVNHALTHIYGAARIYLAVVPIILFIEWRLGRPIKKYRSRAHFHQLAWYIFHFGGIHEAIFFLWINQAMNRHLGFLNLHLLDKFPMLVRFVVIFVLVDLGQYWVHRLRHTRLLWPFHATHHACESLTPGALSQVHPVDDYAVGLLLNPPLMMLGTYPAELTAFFVIRTFVAMLEHSDVTWRFGPLYNVFVSPVFHRVHHARTKEFQNKNFAVHLSFWDYLFGTAVNPAEVPDEYGVEGVTMPTLSSQVFQPFRLFYREFLSPRRLSPRPAMEDAADSVSLNRSESLELPS